MVCQLSSTLRPTTRAKNMTILDLFQTVLINDLGIYCHYECKAQRKLTRLKFKTSDGISSILGISTSFELSNDYSEFQYNFSYFF